MDCLSAARLRKPMRTNSAPGNPDRVSTIHVPMAFTRAILSKRGEHLGPIAQWKKKKSPPRNKSNGGSDDGSSGPQQQQQHPAVGVASSSLLTKSQEDEEVAASLASESPAATTPPSILTPAKVSLLEENDVQDILAQMAAAESSGPQEEEDEERNAALEQAKTDKPVASSSSSGAARKIDLREMQELLDKLRHTTGKCTPKVEEFAKSLWEGIGEGEKAWQMFERSKMMQEAAPTVRRRRLFGEKEPALHQRVLGVLNKVTDDVDKYREIKHELMRLPLPEADPESLDLVVQCFFTKAVREQQFSSYYADLVEELCRVPKGQVQTGNQTESLSYRLRVALVQRCQREFTSHKSLSSLPRVNEQGKPFTDDELEMRRITEKKKLCGNVKFVGELYLRKMVSARVVQFVILMLLCGTNNKEALFEPLPPPFIPEENECDQLITLLKTVGEALLQTDIGRETISGVRNIVSYLAVHHPVRRTQFLLQELLEVMARGFVKQVAPTQAALVRREVEEAQRQAVAAAGGGVSSSSFAGNTAADVSRQGSFHSPDFATPQRHNSSGPGSNGPSTTSSPSAVVTKQQLPLPPNHQVVVGIPVPRSNQPTGGRAVGVGATPTPPSNSPVPSHIGSMGSSPAVQVGRSLSMTPPPQSAPLLPMPTTRIAASADSIASLVAQLLATSDFAGVAHQLVHGFQNAFLAIELWIVRTMSLIKAERERLQLGELLTTLHEYHSIPLEVLRGTARAALRKCMDKELYEMMRLWKFWAQVVAGDTQGKVLNDDLHNEALLEVLRYFGELRPKVDHARQFIVDVLAVQMTKSSETVLAQAPCPRNQFARFRPLRTLLVHAHESKQDIPTFMRSVLVHDSIAKAQDFELSTYTSLLFTPIDLRILYSDPANSSKYSDPTAVAKVLSAIFFAEMSIENKNFLDSNLELLRFVADGRERPLRELCVVAELYHATKTTKDLMEYGRSMLSGSRWMNRLLNDGVVTKESKMEADRLYKDDPEAMYAIGPPLGDEVQALMSATRSERIQGRK